MQVWGLADLHLSFSGAKPMDRFGAHWVGHVARVEAAWRERVAPDDVVCLPGDLSWAMRPGEIEAELAWLGGLPGRKVQIQGNHDYWWGSVAKVRRLLPEGVYALQNDTVTLGGAAFAGARGWVDESLEFSDLLPESTGPGGEPQMQHDIRGVEEDRRLYQRELGRLENSLRELDDRAALRVALLHFPPTSPSLEETPVTRLLERYRVDVAVFGHLHGPGWETFANPYGERDGVRYFLVSADFARFQPVLLARTAV
ncbi:MAG TPA: metallophosphoesterase [Deferrisomatales bacterium]|nr:metallophosphoesterase [Deferrisomatales bacterium]